MRLFGFGVLIIFLSVSCGRVPSEPTALITFQARAISPGGGAGASAPSTLGDFNCIALNVVGPGITGQDAYGASIDSVISGNHCTYPGVSSVLAVATTSSATLSASVPTGKNRVVQVVGLTTTGSCRNVSFAQILREARAGTAFDVTGIFEIGRAVVSDLSMSTNLTITSTYNSSSPKNLLSCVAAAQ